MPEKRRAFPPQRIGNVAMRHAWARLGKSCTRCLAGCMGAAAGPREISGRGDCPRFSERLLQLAQGAKGRNSAGRDLGGVLWLVRVKCGANGVTHFKMLLVPFMMIHIRSRGRCIRAGAHSGLRGLGWVGKAGARQKTCSEKAGGGKAE